MENKWDNIKLINIEALPRPQSYTLRRVAPKDLITIVHMNRELTYSRHSEIALHVSSNFHNTYMVDITI